MQEQDVQQFSQMSELPEEALGPRTYEPGEAMEGEVVRIDQDGIIVSVGLKMEGVVPSDEMRSLSAEELGRIKQGDTLLVTIVGGRGPGDMALLSVDRAREHLWWQELRDSLDSGGRVTAKVTGHNRGGMEVQYRSIRGFVPFSHLAPDSSSSDGNVLEQRIGQECPFNVIEVDQDQGRLILSERAIWRQRQEEERVKLIQQVEVGTTMPGKVTSVRGFGAFVDIGGGVQGLVHISELSWDSVNKPEDVVQVGDELDVFVLRVDAENKKIALSLRRLQPEPWETINERYQVGDIVEATVTKLTNFGAFARVEGSVEGLIHISELTSRIINHPREVVGEGDTIRLKILRIEPERRRLGLSLKEAQEEEEGF